MKICLRCRQGKPFNKFKKSDVFIDGYNSWCNNCISKKHTETSTESTRISTLEEAYRKRIKQLKSEIKQLQSEVKKLERLAIKREVSNNELYLVSKIEYLEEVINQQNELLFAFTKTA